MKFIFLSLSLIICTQSLAQVPVQGRIETKQQETEQNTEKTVLIKSTAYEKTFTAPPIVSEELACEIEISSDYWQLGDRAKLEALIETDQCAAAQGEYTVRVKTRNDNGDARTRKFQETWSRADNVPVTVKHVYDMDGDAELVNIRVHMSLDTACTCIQADE